MCPSVPREIITEDITKLVTYPEALQVLDFAQGQVQLAAIRAFHGGPLVGHELKDLKADTTRTAEVDEGRKDYLRYLARLRSEVSENASRQRESRSRKHSTWSGP